MKVGNKLILLIIFSIIGVLFFATNSYAGYQEWNALDYDVTVHEDGSMDVIETWNVYISETNTLFKDFEMDINDYFSIEDVKITEVENGIERPLTQIYEEQYHVDSGCFYALQIKPSVFEIAWNVGLDYSSDTRTYKMYYTVKDAVKVYDDCTELYWQFLSRDNTMTGDNVTGIIRLPRAVSNIEKLRVWGHGNLSAEIEKVDKKTVRFTQPRLYSNELLEVRIITEENIYPYAKNVYSLNELESILTEEQTWADDANRQREEAKREEAAAKIIFVGFLIFNGLILLLFVKKSMKYKKEREEIILQYSSSDIYDYEYFRDIPDEKNATPGKAMYLYLFRKNSANINSSLSQIFSATILNLALKGVLTFEMVNDKEVRIYISSGSTEKLNTLERDEKLVYELISKAIWGKGYTTTKEFARFASREYDLVYSKLNRIDNTVEDILEETGKISRDKKAVAKKWSKKQIGYFIGAFMVFMFMPYIPAITIGLVLLGISARKNAVCFSVLTDEGEDEAAQWKGLKKYMEDYSLLNEKQVPDIVLWEKYLVYATAFGISDKVIRQLKMVHPEMFEARDDYNRYTYWNMVSSPRFNSNMFNDFSRDLGRVYDRARNAYSAAHSSSSSGSGGGGGFSGGSSGGGGGGGGSCGGR